MAQLVSTRNPLHSTRPLTVGVIPDAASLSLWSSMSPVQREATCDILELRLDTLKTPAADLITRCGLEVMEGPDDLNTSCVCLFDDRARWHS